MARTERWFWLAVALQILVLLAIAGRQQYTLATGAPMRLKPEPADPWDMFRGDYVRLRFAANEVPFAEPVRPGESLWVLFRAPAAGQKHWTAVAAGRERPAAGPGELAVRGRVRWHSGGRAGVEYGFEYFYVPAGRGRELERDADRLEVEVAVDRFGRAALRTVLVDGRPVRWG